MEKTKLPKSSGSGTLVMNVNKAIKMETGGKLILYKERLTMKKKCAQIEVVYYTAIYIAFWKTLFVYVHAVVLPKELSLKKIK